MAKSEIDAVRELLRSKPRPAGLAESRERIDAIGSASPPARDIRLEPTVANGIPAEWSLAPGSDPSRVLLFFHGGGYCSGSIMSHRGMVTAAVRGCGRRSPRPAIRDRGPTGSRQQYRHRSGRARIAGRLYAAHSR